MGFKVVRVSESEQVTSRETVTLFAERWEAEEFAKSRSLQPHPEGKVWYEIEETRTEEKIPPPKTIVELIDDAIKLLRGRAELRQIYPAVQKSRPNASEDLIRGVLNRGVMEGKFIRKEDHSYALVSPSTKQVKTPSPVTSGVISGEKLFLPYVFSGPKGEAQLEDFVKSNYRRALGEGTLYLPIKKLIGSKLKKVTDGLLLDFNDKKHPRLWIVEAELSSHDLEDHIQKQVVGFLRALEDEGTLRMLVKAIRDSIYKSQDVSDDWIQDFFVPFWENGTTDYEFLDNLLHEKCGILIVIDEVTPDLEAIVKFLSKWGTVKVMEFRTFSGDGQFIHTFSRRT